MLRLLQRLRTQSYALYHSIINVAMMVISQYLLIIAKVAPILIRQHPAFETESGQLEKIRVTIDLFQFFP